MSRSELKGVEITKCGWNRIWPSGEALFLEHRAEIKADFPGIPYQMDFVLASEYDKLGIMQCVAAHVDGDLIGYCIFFISPSIESAGSLVASQGPWFVGAKWRALRDQHSNVAFAMWKEAKAALTERGVKQVLVHRYERSDPRLDFFFARQGAKPFARVFSMTIGEEK